MDAYQNPQSGYPQPPKISTSLITFWDGNRNGTKLDISALNSGLSFNIAVPVVGPNGNKTYPKEFRTPCILIPRNAMLIEDAIFHKMLDAFERGENCSVSLFSNTAKSTVFELTLENGEFGLNLHINCDPTSHIPGHTVKFKFDVGYINESFNKDTGDFNAVPINADFFLFAKLIRAYNDLCQCNLVAQGTKLGMNSFNNTLMDYIRSIATAVQAQIPVTSYNNYGGNNYSGNYQSNNYQNNNNRGFNQPVFQQQAQVMQQAESQSTPVPTQSMSDVDEFSDLFNAAG